MDRPELEGMLTAYDFEGGVAVTFEDGSHVSFNHAFARFEGDDLVIYTEHNGYHVFPWYIDDAEGVHLWGTVWDDDRKPDPRGEPYWTKG